MLGALTKFLNERNLSALIRANSMTIFKYEFNEIAMQESLKVLSGNETKVW